MTQVACGRFDKVSHRCAGKLKYFLIDGVSISFQDTYPVFMHISDIEGEYIPRKGDRVLYNVCPMPPRFDKPQGVHIKIIDFTPEVHKKWSEKETAEELAEDAAAIQEEKEMTDKLKGPGPLTPITMVSPHRRPSSGCGGQCLHPATVLEQHENGNS